MHRKEEDRAPGIPLSNDRAGHNGANLRPLHHLSRVGVAAFVVTDDALAAIAVVAGAENIAAVDTADVTALAGPAVAVVAGDYVVGAAPAGIAVAVALSNLSLRPVDSTWLPFLPLLALLEFLFDSSNRLPWIRF